MNIKSKKIKRIKMAQNKPPVQARFQRLGSDLFWEVYDREQDKFIRWSGYDDGFWWEHVATSDQFQIRGSHRLDPFTNMVSHENG